MAVAERACNTNMNFLLQTDTLSASAPHVLESLWESNSSTSFHGSKSMLSFENVQERATRNRSSLRQPNLDENCEDDFNVCFHRPEKKRRLSDKQVLFLEKNFEVENKLEPERKVELAKELGLHPRQVAIWFQNRRARFKTKQLEKEYDLLKASYDNLKVNHDNLSKENDTLKDEVQLLVQQSQSREKDHSNSEPNNRISPSPTKFQKPFMQMMSMAMCKQEDASSGSCESPRHTVLDTTESSHALGTDQSDFSQDEDDNNLGKTIFPQPYALPKLEDFSYGDPPASSCNFGFQLEEQPIWLWPC